MQALSVPDLCCAPPRGQCASSPLSLIDLIDERIRILSGDSINVDAYGAVGDGIIDDTGAFKLAFAALNDQGGGSLEFGIGKTYLLSSLADGYSGFPAPMLQEFLNLSGIFINGNGSTVNFGSNTTYGSLLIFNGCDTIKIENIHFKSDAVTVHNDQGVECLVFKKGANKIVMQNLDFTYVPVAYTFRGSVFTDGGSDTNRCRDIVVMGEKAFGVYYPCLFQGAGDNFSIHGFSSQNCGRSYYNTNANNHDIWIVSEPGAPATAGGGFSDCLISARCGAGIQSWVKNIKVNYTSLGRYPGSLSQLPGEALVHLNFFQHVASPSAPGTLENIDVTVNTVSKSPDKDNSLFRFRKFTSTGVPDPTPRGYIVENVTLRGTALGCENMLDHPVSLFAQVGDNWTGDFVRKVSIQDLRMDGNGGTLGILCDATPFVTDGQVLNISSCFSDMALTVINNTTGIGVVVSDSTFQGVLYGHEAKGGTLKFQRGGDPTTIGGTLDVGGQTNVTGTINALGHQVLSTTSTVPATGPVIGLDARVGKSVLLYNKYSGIAQQGTIEIEGLETLNFNEISGLVTSKLGLATHGLSLAVLVKTTTYVIPSYLESVFLCDTTAGGFTITLPAIGTFLGAVVIIKKISADGNTLTIASAGGTIDGAATKTTTTQYAVFRFVAGPVEWSLI